jgi:hypothetical protein
VNYLRCRCCRRRTLPKKENPNRCGVCGRLYHGYYRPSDEEVSQMDSRVLALVKVRAR